MAISEKKIRQIIHEESAQLLRRPLREGKFSYSAKLRMLEDAHSVLLDVAEYEAHESAGGEDPDLEELIRGLEGLMDAVAAMAADEDTAVDPFVPPRTPRSMRY